MSRQKAFTDELCYFKEDNIFTVALTEDTAAELETIEDIELPQVGESVDHESVVGTLETDLGTIDLYSPVDGEVVEINDLVLEDPTIIIEDPEEGWLFKVESEDNPEDYEDSRRRDDDDESEEDNDDNDSLDDDENSHDDED
ncbi:MAG: glycine cleavage system protein H [Pseudobdellovibrionaceae bacterium]|nr:glycine cleavage system protein H [Pseudobdellovibrionaceae bacterium]